MKKALYLVFICFTIPFLQAQDTLRYNDLISRQLELEFNQTAKELDAYAEWALIGDWDDFEVSFNQGNYRRDRFTISAKDYENFIDGNYGILITIKPLKRAVSGLKTLKMEVVDVGAELDFDGSLLNLYIPEFYYQAPPPTPWWLTLLYILAAAFVLFNIVWFVFLKKTLYPKMKGTLQFSDGSIIKLNDCYNYVLYTSHKKPSIAKDGVIAGIYCGKKGSYQMPYTDGERSDNKFLLIKAEKGRKGYINKLDKISNIEFLSSNKKLYHEEEYSFKDANDDMIITFTYDNIKHQM